MNKVKTSTAIKAETKSIIENLFSGGIPCHYARFHQPVPPYLNKEPVSEFRQKNEGFLPTAMDKYVVDEMRYTSMGLVFKMNKELNIVPLANIIYIRT